MFCGRWNKLNLDAAARSSDLQQLVERVGNPRTSALGNMQPLQRSCVTPAQGKKQQSTHTCVPLPMLGPCMDSSRKETTAHTHTCPAAAVHGWLCKRACHASAHHDLLQVLVRLLQKQGHIACCEVDGIQGAAEVWHARGNILRTRTTQGGHLLVAVHTTVATSHTSPNHTPKAFKWALVHCHDTHSHTHIKAQHSLSSHGTCAHPGAPCTYGSPLEGTTNRREPMMPGMCRRPPK